MSAHPPWFDTTATAAGTSKVSGHHVIRNTRMNSHSIGAAGSRKLPRQQLDEKMLQQDHQLLGRAAAVGKSS
jgi:hypothetical protein